MIDQKMKLNSFHHKANQYRKIFTEEHIIEATNVTSLFYKELEAMLDNKELIIIQINAKVRLGKSTLAIKLGKHIFELLKKKGLRKKEEQFGMRNIARDQHEYSKFMRDPNLKFDIIVTDEHNSMETGGVNSTREEALLKDFSNVQAARYVHRVNCSPAEVADPNTDIILEIKATDKQTKTTRALLFYRMYKGGETYPQLLGYIDIYVGDVINAWDNHVKKLFLQPTRTPEEEKLIKKYQEEDFYVMYNVKKMEKLNMYQEEGIESPRKLEYAELTLKCIEELKDLTKMKGLLKRETVRNFVKFEAAKLKIPLSLVGIHDSTEEILGVLEGYKAIREIEKKEEISHQKMSTRRINPEVRMAEKMMHERMLLKIANVIKAQLNELERYCEIKEKYNETECDKRKENINTNKYEIKSHEYIDLYTKKKKKE